MILKLILKIQECNWNRMVKVNISIPFHFVSKVGYLLEMSEKSYDLERLSRLFWIKLVAFKVSTDLHTLFTFEMQREERRIGDVL